ncbi:hypothetical protein RU07_01475 [Agrobacterium tumefaciens]|uniref:Uncharacterized protein n=1 Tax=Agrobacterium tumefaciens TaxID=358 RepID=A0A0D0K9T8_AGRTU|nr:hypothetical protein RU07_01475 [Agrobacterium tumefaciens]
MAFATAPRLRDRARVSETFERTSCHPLKSTDRSSAAERNKKDETINEAVTKLASTIRSAARGVTPGSVAIIAADTNGLAITSSISPGSFDDVRPPTGLRTVMVRASASR